MGHSPEDLAKLRSELVALMRETARGDPSNPPIVREDTPCVGGELLQDSLDVLEFVVALERVYGVSVRDASAGRNALSSVGALTMYVAQSRIR